MTPFEHTWLRCSEHGSRTISWLLASTLIGACQANASTPQRGDRVNVPHLPEGKVEPAHAPIAGRTSDAAPGVRPVNSAPVEHSLPGSRSRCPALPRPPRITSGTSCGPLDCRSFEVADDAIAFILRETQPVILGVGEIHAQKEAAIELSSTRRFSRMLPLFCEDTRHIVIELWTARNDCGDQRTEDVRRAQEPVTQAQAPTNQNEFFELGRVAQANRIQPHALTPTCEDFASILAAKDNDIARMLELTATRSADLAEDLLRRAPNQAGVPYILLYGGTMHNDLRPASGREPFSYGPRLAESTNGRYVELDLVLREQVKDTESYRRFAWYDHFRNKGLEDRNLLYRVGPRSFTLIFPASTRETKAP